MSQEYFWKTYNKMLESLWTLKQLFAWKVLRRWNNTQLRRGHQRLQNHFRNSPRLWLLFEQWIKGVKNEWNPEEMPGKNALMQSLYINALASGSVMTSSNVMKQSFICFMTQRRSQMEKGEELNIRRRSTNKDWTKTSASLCCQCVLHNTCVS